MEVPQTFDRVRDSKHKAVELVTGKAGWAAFLTAAKSDGFITN